MGFIWATFSLVILSSWFVITRFSVTHELRIWDIMALRFGVGALILVPTAGSPPAGYCLVGRASLLPALGVAIRPARGGRPATNVGGRGSLHCTGGDACVRGNYGLGRPGRTAGKARWLGYGAIVVGLISLVEAGAASDGAPNAIGLLALVGAALRSIQSSFDAVACHPAQAAALICTWSAILFLPAYVLLGLSRLPLTSSSELAVQTIYQGEGIGRSIGPVSAFEPPLSDRRCAAGRATSARCWPGSRVQEGRWLRADIRTRSRNRTPPPSSRL
jgi:hypothetical protein